MPRVDNPETTCVIQFNALKVQNCMLMLDNKTILTELFTGLYTDPIYGTRGFITFTEKQSNNESFNLDEAVIKFSNFKLRLTKDDIYLFCELVDSYANKYIEYISNIENILKSHNFALSKRRNNYKLLYIEYPQWKRLVKFAENHDVDKGSSRWHIFDRNNFFIKIYTDKEMPTLNIGYHGFFKVEYNDDIVLYPDFGLSSLCITYEFMEDLDKKGVEYINHKENWDVETAYKWLVDQFIPKVLGRSWKREHNRIYPYEEIFNNQKNHFKIVYLEKVECKTLQELRYIVHQLQMHFHSHPHYKYRVYKQDIKGLYDSISICLENSNKADLHYICQKLHIFQCKTKSELSISINEIAEQINDTTIIGFGVDLLFRSLCAALESENINLTQKDIDFIRNNLRYYIEIHDREVLLKKYALDFI